MCGSTFSALTIVRADPRGYHNAEALARPERPGMRDSSRALRTRASVNQIQKVVSVVHIEDARAARGDADPEQSARTLIT